MLPGTRQLRRASILSRSWLLYSGNLLPHRNEQKLASTVCYHSVLEEMLAYAGRALERLIEGIQSREEIVPDMSLALFLQLCSRQEGATEVHSFETHNEPESMDSTKYLQSVVSSRGTVPHS